MESVLPSSHPFLDRWLEFERQARAVSEEAIEMKSVQDAILVATQRVRFAEGVDLSGAAGARLYCRDYHHPEKGRGSSPGTTLHHPHVQLGDRR